METPIRLWVENRRMPTASLAWRGVGVKGELSPLILPGRCRCPQVAVVVEPQEPLILIPRHACMPVVSVVCVAVQVDAMLRHVVADSLGRGDAGRAVAIGYFDSHRIRAAVALLASAAAAACGDLKETGDAIPIVERAKKVIE